jgi:YbbR domain-containing protein
LKGFFTKNVPVKLISIFLAIILWYFVISEKSGETALSIPLEFRNIPTSLIIIKNPEESINIRISGPVTLLRALSPREVRAVIDLADARPGLAEFAVQPEDITLPRGLRVTMISPASIGLRFERLAKRSVPVKVLLVGQPYEGFKLTMVSVDPPVVEIGGAQTELARLENIPTQAIDITGCKGDSVRKAPLNLGGLHIKSITREDVNVHIKCAKVSRE